MEHNPYRMINEALTGGDLNTLEPMKDLLYLVMRALRKMPIIYNKPLYRGIRSDILNGNKPDGTDDSGPGDKIISENDGTNKSTTNDNISNPEGSNFRSDRSMFIRGGDSFDEDYLKGEWIVWPALSSTSPNIAATKAFLAKGTKSKKAEGTLFIIENGWGYDVQSCSMFPNEEEIVLEPERRFRVKTIIPGEGLTIIKMEMLKTPLVLPEVFGEAKGKASKTNTDVDENIHISTKEYQYMNRETWLQMK